MKIVINNFLWILGVTLLILSLFIVYDSCKEKKEIISEIENITSLKQDSIAYYKDFADREHALRLQTEASKKAVSIVYKNEIDSLIKILNIKEKQLKQALLIGTETKDDFQLDIVTDIVALPDSNEKTIKTFNYTDQWLYLKGTIEDNKVSINYLNRDSLTASFYWKRKNFLSRKQYYVDVYSLNPNTRIKGLKDFKINDFSDKKFVITLNTSLGYDGIKVRPYVGLGIGYKLFEF